MPTVPSGARDKPSVWGRLRLGGKRRWVPTALGLLLLLAIDLRYYSPVTFDAACRSEQESFDGLGSRVIDGLVLHLTQWRFDASPLPRVALLTIGDEQGPAVVDPCSGRRFMTVLIPLLVRIGAREIVIDKYYSRDGCGEVGVNGRLLAAMRQSERDHVPVVAGFATRPRQNGDIVSGCYTLAPSLLPAPAIDTASAGQRTATLPASTGLVRIDSNPLRIPLRFPAFADDGRQADYPTLSRVAAERLAPSVEAGLGPYAGDNFPFTSFVRALPRGNAFDVLCRQGGLKGTTEWGVCAKPGPEAGLEDAGPDLRGMVVVIGDEVADQDLKPVPGGQLYGVELQANYIESLLDGRFLRPMGLALDLLFFLLLVGVLHFAGVRPAGVWQRLGWSLAVIAGFLVLSVALLLLLNYYPPVKSFVAVFLNPFLAAAGTLGERYLQPEPRPIAA